MSSSNKKIRLLTFNIFIRPPIVVERDKRDERLLKIIEFINNSDYDIICLQELFGYRSLFSSNNNGKNKLKLLNNVKGKYPYQNTSKTTTKTIPVDGGLVILSKHKFEMFGEQSFPSKTLTGPDKFSRKGFIWCTILIDKTPILIINTHTQAIYNEKQDYEYLKSQLDIIREWLLMRLNEYDTLLLIGDLNTSNRKDFPKFIDANDVGYTWPTPLMKNQQKNKKLNLDYILVIKGNKLSSSKVLYRIAGLSDHYPVEAEIKI